MENVANNNINSNLDISKKFSKI